MSIAWIAGIIGKWKNFKFLWFGESMYSAAYFCRMELAFDEMYLWGVDSDSEFEVA